MQKESNILFPVTSIQEQGLVFSVKLHLDLILYPLTFDPYPLPLPLVPYPLVLFLLRNLGEDSSSSSSRYCYCSCSCYQTKVKSTPSPWPKTWSLTKLEPGTMFPVDRLNGDRQKS